MYEIIIKQDGKVIAEFEAAGFSTTTASGLGGESNVVECVVEKPIRRSKPFIDGAPEPISAPAIPGKQIVAMNEFRGGAVPVVRDCRDCHGSGKYRPLTGPPESCRTCCGKVGE